jgi:hypothetical protein
MRELFFLGALLPAAALGQLALLPGGLPCWLRPDVGLLIGVTGLVFLRRGPGLILFFALGVQADLVGGARFGLLTLGYLLAAATLLSAERELGRTGSLGVWLASIAATAVAHGSYALLAPLAGVRMGSCDALGTVGQLTLAAALFGWPLAWFLGQAWAWTGVLSAEARLARSRRRRATAGAGGWGLGARRETTGRRGRRCGPA